MSELAAKPHQTYSFNEFTVDLGRGCLWRGAEEVKLRPKVFEALSYLVVHNNRLVTKDELIKALWTDTFVTDDSLVQCVVELRRALGDGASACLKTVPRRGYIFTAEVQDARAAAVDAHGEAGPRPIARAGRPSPSPPSPSRPSPSPTSLRAGAPPAPPPSPTRTASSSPTSSTRRATRSSTGRSGRPWRSSWDRARS